MRRQTFKVVQAAVQQLESIRYIEKHLGLGKLPLTLRETAELRLNHPDASLNELADLSEGKIGKSGINHQKKIQHLAEELGMIKNE